MPIEPLVDVAGKTVPDPAMDLRVRDHTDTYQNQQPGCGSDPRQHADSHSDRKQMHHCPASAPSPSAGRFTIGTGDMHHSPSAGWSAALTELDILAADYAAHLWLFPGGEHSRQIDLQPVKGQPGGIGQRLAHTLRLGHGRDERYGAILFSMESRGEVFRVVQGGHN
jgi:hypothetical protein